VFFCGLLGVENFVLRNTREVLLLHCHRIIHRGSDRETIVCTGPKGQKLGVTVAREPASAVHVLNAARALQHLEKAKIPNVQRLAYVGQCGDSFQALATFWIEGESLWRRVVTNGPVERSIVEVWYSSLKQALSRVHSAGLLHRDVTPTNIIIGRDDKSVHLIDFGLAQSTREGLQIGNSLGQCHRLFRWRGPMHELCVPQNDFESLYLSMCFSVLGLEEYCRLRKVDWLPDDMFNEGRPSYDK